MIVSKRYTYKLSLFIASLLVAYIMVPYGVFAGNSGNAGNGIELYGCSQRR